LRKSLFNDEFLVYLGPIISRLFTCSNEEKINKIKKQRVLALVLSLWVKIYKVARVTGVFIEKKTAFY
jgi:hypothetical protein